MFSKKNPQKLSANDLRSSRYGVPLVTVQDPQNVVAEQFRVLRANIDFAAASLKNFKTVLFTSAEMSDGKSTAAQNLAVTWAQTGKRILLLDADFRRPTLHKTFAIPNEHGLTTVLAMHEQPASVIHSTEIPNLYVMTSGPMPPNPSELLASDKMLRVVSWMREQFDMVVIDSTPLLLVTDAQALIPRADGVVLVAMLNKTKRRSMATAAHILKLAKANVLGVVSRDQRRADKGYGYGYGYGYTSTNVMKTNDASKASSSKTAPAKRKVPKASVTDTDASKVEQQVPSDTKKEAPRQNAAASKTAPTSAPKSSWSSFSYTSTGSEKSEASSKAKEPGPSNVQEISLVDIHAHLLPRADDGSDSMTTSLQLAKEAVQEGVHTIVASPNQMDGRYINDPDKVLSDVDNLNNTLKRVGIDLRILPGQEIHLSDQFLTAFDQGRLLTLADSKKYMLVELPNGSVLPVIHQVISKLREHKITMIVAHPERNLALLNDPKELNKLARRGVLFQVTSSSINGFFGQQVADFALAMLRQGFVTTIASETHGINSDQHYHLADAYSIAGKLIGEGKTNIIKQNAVRIVRGEPVDGTTIQEF
ncbi:tyrosine protein kinase [Oenococcus oeni]|uniref:polysaccharide biosynthesis tyrosine autokinase n=1 Tax=Oenococcus oeni TaxID=1247 RepID=UPI00050FD8EC|nr:polysaccharide biosynthesis tyrosine autokinase [Oenococcus oeni]KGH69752.1 tyrosine protein kinase [Oenococcus oeni IOEB_9517]KGI03490.1 tyrosine protein kinase [Oenococcus oeni IOEB_L65_2]OIL68565.1 tyrosine protein kinase [Oenococcus oeni]OIM47563.1 tyrosine protein kinase [Oenococcus oeni]OLQ33079.1 tyrosine protein kinase [Oenococcus oeni]